MEWVLWIAHIFGAGQQQVEIARYETEQQCRTAGWKINAEAMLSYGAEPPLRPKDAPLDFGCVRAVESE